ncbi:uncharacterized protein LOC129598143 [Paramacrobiotus metropolitanus]|uniref:uncharacterized protein LOC129598143 n=1 Tax=Paramacrobiotus metropolitanus TaxID=2943436 RepID=UPI002445DE58|nr:uncharacterized protein LOC129598143 [Paramacrobiotus metropolitanus]
MGKFGLTFAAILNRDQTWAYHEIITEALFVLWTGCHLSLKFGTRFFPEWETTRIDPDSYTSLDLLLWQLLGQDITGCMWDDVVSPWKPSTPQTPSNAVMTSTWRGTAGYVGAVAVVVLTVLLGVSVLCSAWVNRHWRFSRWTQHFRHCRRITTWFGYNTTFNGDESDWPAYGATGWRFWALWCLLSLTGMTVFAGLWLVCCALPVVIAAGLTVAWIGRHVGEEAVFPATVVCFGLLAVHCTGRIWGFGMNETYFTQLHEKIRNATGIRFLVQPLAADQRRDTAHTWDAATDESLFVQRARWGRTFLLLVFPAWLALCNHSMLVLHELPFPVGWMDPFLHPSRALLALPDDFSSESVSAAGIDWTTPNCTDCCDNYATGMDQSRAMMSYYVDLKYPRGPTSNPAMVTLFNTVFSPLTERFYCVWMTIVAWAVGLPLIATGTAGAVIMAGCCGSFVFRGLIKILKILSNADDLNKTKTEPEECAIEAKKPFCVCALWVVFERYILVVFSRFIIWLFIPFPLLELMLPEQWLLPAWLLLLSVVEVGFWWWVWNSLCSGCRERRTGYGRVKTAAEDDDAPLLTM